MMKCACEGNHFDKISFDVVLHIWKLLFWWRWFWQKYYGHGKMECSNKKFEFEFKAEVTAVGEKELLEHIRRC